MKQDILRLGGVMLKAQSIFWKDFHITIESKFTISSLLRSIFRINYYDDPNGPIPRMKTHF